MFLQLSDRNSARAGEERYPGTKFRKVVMKRGVVDQRGAAPKFSAKCQQMGLDLGLGFDWAYSNLLFLLGKE